MIIFKKCLNLSSSFLGYTREKFGLFNCSLRYQQSNKTQSFERSILNYVLRNVRIENHFGQHLEGVLTNSCVFSKLNPIHHESYTFCFTRYFVWHANPLNKKKKIKNSVFQWTASLRMKCIISVVLSGIVGVVLAEIRTKEKSQNVRRPKNLVVVIKYHNVNSNTITWEMTVRHPTVIDWTRVKNS